MRAAIIWAGVNGNYAKTLFIDGNAYQLPPPQSEEECLEAYERRYFRELLQDLSKESSNKCDICGR